MQVKFKLLSYGAELPTRATSHSAGFDCCADLVEGDGDPLIIQPGEQALIGLGFAMEPPAGHAGLLLPRSGLGTKKGAVLANTIGLIDEDYRGEVKACIKNTSKEPLTIVDGERICQLVIVPVFMGKSVLVEELSDTARGEGGFGSTGHK